MTVPDTQSSPELEASRAAFANVIDTDRLTGLVFPDGRHIVKRKLLAILERDPLLDRSKRYHSSIDQNKV